MIESTFFAGHVHVPRTTEDHCKRLTARSKMSALPCVNYHSF